MVDFITKIKKVALSVISLSLLTAMSCGIIPIESKSKVLLSNKSILFRDFDTGHNVMSESPNEYFEFVSEFLKN